MKSDNGFTKILKDVACEHCMARPKSIFREINSEVLKSINELNESIRFSKDEVIFSDSKKYDGVFCIRNGIVKLYKTLDDHGHKKQCLISLHGSGDLIGFSTYKLNGNDNSIAIAMDDVVACFLDRKIFEDVISKSQIITHHLCKHMVSQIDESAETISHLSTMSVKERVARSIAILAQKFGEKREGKIFLNLKLSREDYANLSGTVVETLVRTFTEFKNNGLIAVKGKSITVLNFSGLKEIAGIKL